MGFSFYSRPKTIIVRSEASEAASIFSLEAQNTADSLKNRIIHTLEKMVEHRSIIQGPEKYSLVKVCMLRLSNSIFDRCALKPARVANSGLSKNTILVKSKERRNITIVVVLDGFG